MIPTRRAHHGAGGRASRVLGRVGRWSARHAWLVVGAWLVAAVPLVLLAPSLTKVGVQDEASFLPASAPSAVAQQVVGHDFPDEPGVDSAVVVLSSRHPFTLADLAFVARLDRFLTSGTMAHLVRSVDSPVATPALDSALVAPGHRVALVVASVRPTSFTPRADAMVQQLQRFLARRSPPGLHDDVTGDVGLGADELSAAVASFDRAALVAGVLVVAVMLVAYRSLLALAVPLATVGVSAAATEGVLGLLATHGLAVSALAGTFVVVIVFGAGTDYCLFLVARQRQEREGGITDEEAAGRTLATTGRVVAASAIIVVLSFMALVTARFGMYRTMGPAMAVSVAVTAAAACTFTPAVTALLGGRLSTAATRRRAQRGSPTWARLGRLVERRPALMAGVGVAGLLGASCGTLGLHQSFDLFDQLPASAPGRLGYDTLAQAFGPGTVAPLEMVVTGPSPFTGPAAGRALTRLTDSLARTPVVASVRSAVDPGGVTSPPPTTPLTAVGQRMLLSDDGRAALIEITVTGDPFGARAQHQVATLRADARRVLRAAGLPADSVLVAGPTAQFADIASVAEGDLWRIVVAVLVVLAVVLAVVLDSVVAPVVLAASLVLSFAAALGVTTLIFERLLGQPSLSFVVPPFLFAILVALGADYTVLVVTAIRDGVDAGASTARAAAAAMVETAPVVSAAGLVLAGSFLALVVAPVPTLQQVGVAIGVGVLADTFVVRPLVVPAAAVVLGDAIWWRPFRRPARTLRSSRGRGARG